jgi:preprotein translocase subunit SecE
VANNLSKVSGEEEEVELEIEADDQDPDVTSGAPPAKVSAGMRSGGDGGGRRPKSGKSSQGFFARTAQFLRDTRAEMRRVSWPTANEVKNTTIITLIAVIFFAIYLFGVDRVWSFLIDHLRTWLGG